MLFNFGHLVTEQIIKTDRFVGCCFFFLFKQKTAKYTLQQGFAQHIVLFWCNVSREAEGGGTHHKQGVYRSLQARHM